MKQVLFITADKFAPGDKVKDGDWFITVETLTRCPSARKGVPKFHVNDMHCFDTLRRLQVMR